MNECYVDKKGKIAISKWWHIGSMGYRRDALPAEHQESMYSCLLRLGEKPENYGYYKRCPHCERKINK